LAHHHILIVGGGAAGITAAAQLRRARPSLQIAVLEFPAEHCYQPGWTLVGGGVFSLEETFRPEADVMPAGVTWIRDAVAGFDPDHNRLSTIGGLSLS